MTNNNLPEAKKLFPQVNTCRQAGSETRRCRVAAIWLRARNPLPLGGRGDHVTI